jgi:hypothetical protein
VNTFYEFPAHEAGLHLTHNEHRNYYETVEQYIEDNGLADSFESEDEMRKAIKDDSLWVLQWYPVTPVGFNRVAASTLYDVMRLANRPE